MSSGSCDFFGITFCDSLQPTHTGRRSLVWTRIGLSPCSWWSICRDSAPDGQQVWFEVWFRLTLLSLSLLCASLSNPACHSNFGTCRSLSVATEKARSGRPTSNREQMHRCAIVEVLQPAHGHAWRARAEVFLLRPQHPETCAGWCRLMQVVWVVCDIQAHDLGWPAKPSSGGLLDYLCPNAWYRHLLHIINWLYYLGWTSILQGLWIIVTILSIPHIEGPYHTMPTEQP